ncbi:MMPL family transporter [Frankia sp. Cr1]|uniref:MMPL family transporter n=1 Tax=Frankia sp. Cr1 TaxID=3073931 RepID=UPI002AD25B3E|nr:MMPL family transporter [Frankia sp. Cr1]
MIRRLATVVCARPRTVVVGWLVLFVLAAPFGLALNAHLKAGGFTDPRSSAGDAAAVLERAFHIPPHTLLVVLHTDAGQVTDFVPAARASAAGLADVTAVRDYGDDPALLSQDRRTTLLTVSVNASDTVAQNLAPTLSSAVSGAVHGAQVDVTGQPALDYALNVHSKKDVEHAEMIAFPVLFVVLLLVFRSVAAMLVPIGVAVVAITCTQGLAYGIAHVVDLQILFTNALSLIGLAVAVDYSLFIVKRFREELRRGGDVPAAVTTAMATAGHSVVFSGLAVMTALLALFVPRIMVFASIGLGGFMVTAVAMAASMTLLPAVLRLLGHRIDWGTVRLGGRAAIPTATAAAGTVPPPVPRLYRRPAIVLALAVAGMLALAWPMTALRLEVPVASASILPADDEARKGFDLVRANLQARDLFPVQVVLTSSGGAGGTARLVDAATRAAAVAAKTPTVGGVSSVASLGLRRDALITAIDSDRASLPVGARTALDQLWSTGAGETAVTQLVVTPTADPDSTATHDLVRRLRSELPAAAGSGVTVAVTGVTAQGVDFDHVVVRSMPVIIGLVAVATFLILLAAFGSWAVPVLALAFNGLVVTAGLGALVLICQHGLHQSVNSVTPVLLFAVMFGLSIDYMVIMMSRIKEFHSAGEPYSWAVLGGLGRTASMVNSAALVMVAVFAAFATAQISVVQQLGIGLALAVILDTVVIRRVILPAALLLAGPRVWRRPGAPTAPIAPDAPAVPIVPELAGTVPELAGLAGNARQVSS